MLLDLTINLFAYSMNYFNHMQSMGVILQPLSKTSQLQHTKS